MSKSQKKNKLKPLKQRPWYFDELFKYRSYEQGKQDLDAYKRAFVTHKDQVVEEICAEHNLSLAREITWAEEAYDLYIDEYENPYGFSALSQVRRKIWESKVRHHIVMQKSKFHNESAERIEAREVVFKEEQEKLTAELMYHKLKGTVDEFLNIDWDVERVLKQMPSDELLKMYHDTGNLLYQSQPKSDYGIASAWALLASQKDKK